MAFHNNPGLTDEQGRTGRWIHQPITINHFGIQASIKEDGKIVIRGIPTAVPGSKDEVEYEEVTIPASLVFKLAGYLKDTRSFQIAETEPSPTDKGQFSEIALASVSAID